MATAAPKLWGEGTEVLKIMRAKHINQGVLKSPVIGHPELMVIIPHILTRHPKLLPLKKLEVQKIRS